MLSGLDLFGYRCWLSIAFVFLLAYPRFFFVVAVIIVIVTVVVIDLLTSLSSVWLQQ